MFNKDILRQITIKQKQDLNLSQNFVKRQILTEIEKWMKDSRVLIITGIRRCGKSTVLKQLMKKQEKYSYFNFEDERLLDFKAQDFESLNEILQEFYGESNTYFFDEIQNKEK